MQTFYIAAKCSRCGWNYRCDIVAKTLKSLYCSNFKLWLERKT